MRPARHISTDAGNFMKKILNWEFRYNDNTSLTRHASQSARYGVYYV